MRTLACSATYYATTMEDHRGLLRSVTCIRVSICLPSMSKCTCSASLAVNLCCSMFICCLVCTSINLRPSRQTGRGGEGEGYSRNIKYSVQAAIFPIELSVSCHEPDIHVSGSQMKQEGEGDAWIHLDFRCAPMFPSSSSFPCAHVHVHTISVCI